MLNIIYTTKCDHHNQSKHTSQASRKNLFLGAKKSSKVTTNLDLFLFLYVKKFDSGEINRIYFENKLLNLWCGFITKFLFIFTYFPKQL